MSRSFVLMCACTVLYAGWASVIADALHVPFTHRLVLVISGGVAIALARPTTKEQQ